MPDIPRFNPLYALEKLYAALPHLMLPIEEEETAIMLAMHEFRLAFGLEAPPVDDDDLLAAYNVITSLMDTSDIDAVETDKWRVRAFQLTPHERARLSQAFVDVFEGLLRIVG